MRTREVQWIFTGNVIWNCSPAPGRVTGTFRCNSVLTSPKLSNRMGLPGKRKEQIQPNFEKAETALAYSTHSWGSTGSWKCRKIERQLNHSWALPLRTLPVQWTLKSTQLKGENVLYKQGAALVHWRCDNDTAEQKKNSTKVHCRSGLDTHQSKLIKATRNSLW